MGQIQNGPYQCSQPTTTKSQSDNDSPMLSLHNESKEQLVGLSQGWLSHVPGGCIHTIPSFILCLEGVLQPQEGQKTSRTRVTSKDKSCLAVLWRASQSTGQCALSNPEIAIRAGIRSSKETQETLQRLERFGFIRRTGNHRNRTIRFLVPTPLDHQKRLTLIIPESINHHPNLNHTQKTLLTAYIAFQDTLKKKGSSWASWLANRCGMKVKAVRWNLSKLLQNPPQNQMKLPLQLGEEPPPKSPRNPPQNHPEPPPKSPDILVESRVLGREFSRENLNSREFKLSLLPGLHTPNNKETIPIKEETPREEGMNYASEGYLVDCRKHRPSKKVRPIPKDILLELTEEIFQHKHITIHKVSHELAEAARVVSALKRKGGLSNYLTKEQVESTVTYMSTICKFDPREIQEVLHKKFNDEERVELYKRLSDDMSPSYGGTGKKVKLADAAWFRWKPGFCRMVKVWLRPPVVKDTTPPIPKVPKELEETVTMIKRFLPELVPNVYELKAIKDLKDFHQTTVIPKLETLGVTEGRMFANWLWEFLRFAYNRTEGKDIKLHIGWIRPGGILFNDWIAEFNSRTTENWKTAGRGEMIRQAFEKREREEYEAEFRREYGV